MGYTHYWKSVGLVIDDKTFLDFTMDAKRIVDTAIDAGIGIVGEWEPKGFFLNGVAENGHETFIFNQELEPFEFCKTNGKPYDMVVTAILILAKKYFGKDLKVSSDGSWAEWEGGRLLYETTFDINPKEDEVFK